MERGRVLSPLFFARIIHPELIAASLVTPLSPPSTDINSQDVLSRQTVNLSDLMCPRCAASQCRLCAKLSIDADLLLHDVRATLWDPNAHYNGLRWLRASTAFTPCPGCTPFDVTLQLFLTLQNGSKKHAYPIERVSYTLSRSHPESETGFDCIFPLYPPKFLICGST